jgi:hypothetical protein
MNTVIVAGMFELARLSLQTYFEYMRIAGKTEAEADQIYEETKRGFVQRRPYDLPDPE